MRPTLDSLKADLTHATYFTLFAYWPGNDGERLYTVETPMLRTVDEVIKAISENSNVVLVHQHDYDCARRDCSEDVARVWRDRLEWDDPVPDFVSDYFPRTQMA